MIEGLQLKKKGVALSLLAACVLMTQPGRTSKASNSDDHGSPIKHVVVIFQENVSFDHYFATYPMAANPSGEPTFVADSSDSVNGLGPALLLDNPNLVLPFRLDRSQNYTCDQNHDYTPEQEAMDSGLMDKFVQSTGVGAPGCPDYGHGTALTMGYYDGNTVTAMWNYAQHFALNDNSYGTTMGPSTPGALNLISGQTAGVDFAHTTGVLGGTVQGDTVIGDADPFYDDCGHPAQFAMNGTNIGDLLNSAGITWGWFEGGFAPTVPATSTTPAVCGAKTANLGGSLQTDYSPHHEPFQYFFSTSNPHHLPPTSVAMIGQTDQANHQYDLTDFWAAAEGGNMPAVSFIKAKRAQDGHAGYSSPLDEQAFLVTTLNHLQRLPDWSHTVVIISWDDSDGWYDHAMPPIVNQSSTPADALTGPGSCGAGASPLGGFQARCGYGPRLPLFVISPFAKSNFVDHTLTDQSSILRFIEDNWKLGRIGGGSFDALAGPLTNMLDLDGDHHLDRVFLDPSSGEVTGRDED